MPKRRKRKPRTRVRLRCDRCHKPVIEDEWGNHDSAFSWGHWDAQGFVFVAWCRYCGWEEASDH
jgi:hypothetical protein